LRVRRPFWAEDNRLEKTALRKFIICILSQKKWRWW